MLQTLNVPSSPLPEVPNAPASASANAPGDAGERAEFAQLLQQAQAVDGEGAADEPTVRRSKDAPADHRVRPGSARSAQDHKPHAQRAGAGHEPVEAPCEPSDPTASRHPNDVTADVPVIDTASATPTATPTATADDTAAVMPDAAAMAVPLRPAEPPPAVVGRMTADAAASMGEERRANARLDARSGGRDLRMPSRPEAHSPATADAARTAPAPDVTLPPAKDASAFELALRAGGRATGAPSFDRTAAEPAMPTAPAIAFARELQIPMTRGDAAAEAALHAAPDDAGFAPALGAQVALWVKDGVQEARLQLHPAELGPVSVQIALDGQAAHVDFTAAVAATRQSIEQSLPALAAALRESGFTLAGGGVFGGRSGANDSGRERAPDGRGHGTRGATAIGADGGEAMVTTPRRWARSLVDVYA